MMKKLGLSLTWCLSKRRSKRVRTAGKMVQLIQGQVVREVDTLALTPAEIVGLMKKLEASDLCHMDCRCEELTNRISYSVI